MADAEELITEETLRGMKKAKVFKMHQRRVNSLDFSRDGELLVTSGDDEMLNLFSALDGKHRKGLPVKKYGCGLVRFCQHSSTVVCTSQNDFEDSLRYLSLHDNRYLRYFKGHRDRVVSLAMSPRDDGFISASNDQTVRLWDLRVAAGQGRMLVGARPCVAYDPEGLIFAVGYAGGETGQKQTVKLFDVRNYDAGPFSTMVYPENRQSPNCIRFANDGKHFLVSTTSVEPEIKLFDAFDGAHVATYSGHSNDGTLELEPCFTPDAKFVLSGSEDGVVHVWEKLSGRLIATLDGHALDVSVLQFNPVYLMLATACQNVVLWLKP